jgi:lipoprotein-releasing system permease protein
VREGLKVAHRLYQERAVLNYIWFIALRYFRPRRSSAMIAIISLVSMAAICLGVWAFIVVISVQAGMENMLRSQLIGVQSHLNIRAGYHDEGISDYKRVCEVVMENPEVIGAAPTIIGYGVLMTDFRRYNIVELHGINPELEPSVSKLDEYMKVGKLDYLRVMTVADATQGIFLDELEPEIAGILIGKVVATQLFPHIYLNHEWSEERVRQELEKCIGERIKLLVPEALNTTDNFSMPNLPLFEVKGIVETGYYSYDSALAFIHLRESQVLHNLNEAAERVSVKLKDPSPDNTSAVKLDLQERLQERMDKSYVVVTWMDQNRVLNSALAMEKKVMAGILGIIILVSTFSVATSLLMLALSKRRDIGILRAMGVSRRAILTVFVLLGSCLSGIGVTLGCLLGYTICRLIEVLEIQIPGGGDIYYAKQIPVLMQWEYFVLVICFTMVVGVLASLLPALLAARLAPVEAIRHE